jgi:hypothetical protein
MEIKTTRCFLYDKEIKKKIRGVELWLLDKLTMDEVKKFRSYGRATRGADGPFDTDPYETYVFVDIVDFRKNFHYNEAVEVLYGKPK